jgi:ethanolamine utilization protein EutN
MKLARVVGTVVSTINAPAFDGRTLLMCDLLDPEGRPAGGYMIAVDSVGAGAGEIVLLLDEGNGARQVLGAPGAPIRTVVVGIVDAVEEPGEGRDAGPARAAAARDVPAARDVRPARDVRRAPRSRRARPTPPQ